MTDYETLSIFAQFAILGATIIYAVFAGGQWWAIHRTLKVARAQDRPWILVTATHAKGWPSDKTNSFPFQFTWSARNVGKSPAFLTHLWVAAEIVAYPMPHIPPTYGECRGFAEVLMAPNGYYSNIMGKTLTESDISSLKAGRTCIMCYGYLHYRDTFNAIHTTRFCSYWHQQGEIPVLHQVGPPSYIQYT